MCVCAQSCLNLYSPVDCSPPCSSVHRIFQARILELFAISFSRGFSQPRDLLSLLHCQADSLPAEPLGNSGTGNNKSQAVDCSSILTAGFCLRLRTRCLESDSPRLKPLLHCLLILQPGPSTLTSLSLCAVTYKMRTASAYHCT